MSADRKSDVLATVPPHTGFAAGRPSVSAVFPGAVQPLAGEHAGLVARARARLDVIGGLSDFTGGLALSVPTCDHVCVTVIPRDDDMIAIESVRDSTTVDGSPMTVPVARLMPSPGKVVDSADGNALLGGSNSQLVRCALGTIAELLRDGVLGNRMAGVTLKISASFDHTTDTGAYCAVAAGTAMALTSAIAVEADRTALARLCQRAVSSWIGVPSGISNVLSMLSPSKAGELLRCRVQSEPTVKALPLPAGVRIVGVDCGTRNENYITRYNTARTAAFMGRVLIDRIIKHERYTAIEWNGYVSNLSCHTYVEYFRDRLPTKIKGWDFLDRFGETGDTATRVDPDAVYKVRSRTEHHIYENARACEFADCIVRAGRCTDPDPLSRAGELMFASHWSYGQRYGLGAVNTELLVRLMRRYGAKAGIYGAKVSGFGCGGVVVVLMRATDEAREALAGAVSAYEERSGQKTRIIPCDEQGASPERFSTQ